MSVAFDRPAQFADTDRHARNATRQARQRLLHLAEHLPEADRWLIEQVYGRGVPLAVLARAEVGGAPGRIRQRQRRLSRRLKSILRRLREPAFQLVATRPRTIPSPARAVARLVFLEGRSLRDTARMTDLSLHHVRNHVRTVRELARIL